MRDVFYKLNLYANGKKINVNSGISKDCLQRVLSI